MYRLEKTRTFDRDLKKSLKRGLDMKRAHKVIAQMRTRGHPAAQHRPHKLKGEWSGFWECHIAPDWLLIYALSEDAVTLYRTGSHNDLFE